MDYQVLIQTHTDTEPKKLPTLRQWIANNTNINYDKHYAVTKIWEPNLYPNWSLETDSFIIRLPSATADVANLVQLVEQCRENCRAIGIRLDKDRKGDYFLGVFPLDEWVWRRLGSSGYSISDPTPLPQPKKPRASKKPESQVLAEELEDGLDRIGL